MARVIVLLYVILFSVYITEQADFLQEKYINKINDEVTTWTVSYKHIIHKLKRNPYQKCYKVVSTNC